MRRKQRFHRSAGRDRYQREMFEELTNLRDALDDAYMRFNAVTEPELVDACVYEINAAQSRYNYMLRKAREYEAAFQAQPGRDDVAWA